jgi:hypothetical protein
MQRSEQKTALIVPVSLYPVQRHLRAFPMTRRFSDGTSSDAEARQLAGGDLSPWLVVADANGEESLEG